MKNQFCLVSVSLFIALAAAGCGGGGSAGGGFATNTLQGTVAIGKPLAGATVTIMSAKSIGPGSYQLVEGVTDSEGRYLVNVGTLPPPYVVTAKSIGHPVFPVMSSFSTTTGTVNVTPLTDLLVAQLTRKPQSYGVALQDMPILEAVTESQISTARQEVVNYFMTRPSKTNQSVTAPIDISAIGDFVHNTFQPKAGDIYDDILEQIGQSLQDNENVFSLQEHLINRAAPATDIQAQATGIIRCEGNICGPTASGSIIISAPYLAKYSLIKAFMQQVVLKDPFPQVTCGPSPAIPGFVPGINDIRIDGSVLRINNSGYAFSTTSLISNVSLAIDDTTSPPVQRYIKSFMGVTNWSADNYSGIYVTFDGQANIRTVEFYEAKDGVSATVTCTKI